jgi:hypothetical protein
MSKGVIFQKLCEAGGDIIQCIPFVYAFEYSLFYNHYNHDGDVTIIPCRNLTLAKCGGEAQHFQSWGFRVLRDSRMFGVLQQGLKHLALGCSWCHWKGLEA